MTVYNSLLDRSDVAGLIPVEYSNEIMNSVASETSFVMKLARRLRDMSVYQKTMPVISALPTAYFVYGSSGSGTAGSAALKQTTEVNWSNVTLQAEEIAAIVPIPEAVLDDANMDIWAMVKPLIATAIGTAIDNAVLWGTNKPSSWPTAIVTAAGTASQAVAANSAGDVYDHIMGASGIVAKVEASGYQVTGHLAHVSMRGKLRGLRETISGSATGMPIFQTSMQAAGNYVLDGDQIYFLTNGAGNANYLMVSGQWDQLVYSMRQDITFKILDQAVIQNSAGEIVYNLAQQDMVALRVVIRCGFQVPNPVNWVKASGQYPFAVYTPT
jgi:HK97 family phage major capsid protein